MKQNITYIVLALLVGLSSFGVSQAYAQQYSNYAGNNKYDLPTTTNQDVMSRIMDGINTLISDITGLKSQNHSDLQTIMNNQVAEIHNQQTMISLLERMAPQIQQPTMYNPATQQPNCHPQGTGVICG